MPETLEIRSHEGPYEVEFQDSPAFDPSGLLEGEPHFLIDAKVARLHEGVLRPVLSHPRALLIEATEENKSVERVIPIIERLVRGRVRRGHVLVAIGGGIVQDVACFTASTLLRGMDWRFAPTTLLAQADSCIGSKSSINLGSFKNILGTFHPPKRVWIHSGFLDTLAPRELSSGVGEILKVHAIAGPEAFDRLAADFDRLLEDRALLLSYVRSALRIKKRYIEEDEFDRGVRNVFNYGHSFGHAIESATDYSVPHGIAVSMGMDLANLVAARRGLAPASHYRRMHPVLRRNYAACAATPIPFEAFFAALLKDKKNTSSALGLIFPVGEGASIEKVLVPPDEDFRSLCREALSSFDRGEAVVT